MVLFMGCERVPEEVMVDCFHEEGPCVKALSEEGITVQFDIDPKPVHAMQDLTFLVTLKKGDAFMDEREVILELSMPGMYMGTNMPGLVFIGKGTYRGTGVLPRCPAGRTVWKAEVLFPYEAHGKKKIASEQFIFRVST